ncbi:hypothetical protein ACQPZF_24300 [Actinosynnema sp. CS-041913]|uniref:hypothetical protein n=1 Tax=Actinosynnema sp. CS-041913 TaxID=3239917 RepID=UPI003D903774
MNRVRAALGRAAVRCEPRGLPLAFGRSALAAAHLAVLAANSDADLFIGGVDPRCDGVRAIGLWCLTGGSGQGAQVARVVAVVVLGVVLSGLSPRWTCVPHWYVAFSFAAGLPPVDGGDEIAQVTTLLLIPLCLGDDRVWQWSAVRGPLPAPLRGVALAGLCTIRAQICVIYLSASVSKLRDPQWRQGTGLHLVMHDPDHGLSSSVRDALGPVLGSYWLIATATWAVIVVQLAIAVAVLGGRSARRVALVLGVGLHGTIAVMMNLPAFGLVVIGLLAVGCASMSDRSGDAAPGGGGVRPEPGRVVD